MSRRRPDPDDVRPEQPESHAKASESVLGESLFPHTESVFAGPDLNRGVPPAPRAIRVLSAIEIALGVALFALIVIGVMYQVLGRYFPQIAWVGAGELALLAMIAMTFITAGYLVGRNGHIVLEIFDGLLKGKKLFVALRVVSAVIMAVTCVMLAYEAFVKLELEWGRLTAAMHIPYGMLYVFALIGFASAAVHSVMKIPYANRPERQLDISEMDG